MSLFLHSFVHLLFIGIIALLPVADPIGAAFMVAPYFSHLSTIEKRQAVGKISIYAFFICMVSLIAGHWILEFFGISIPVVRIAGGIMICKMGWEFLSSDKQEEGPDEAMKLSGYKNIEDKLFYPITFPVTTGAGTISVLFTLSAESTSPDISEYLINTGAIFLSIIILCLVIYLVFLNTKTVISYLGSHGEKIVNRMIAFLTFCVGLQIAATGIKTLFKI
ncbi:MarC family protein [Mucilaginibacter sp. McL0603]|uniref:MarC family protein n=1 Tax=Mucilaginibacter sp. McL0603 TaxID=3415670 RepID=UPI003CE95191